MTRLEGSLNLAQMFLNPRDSDCSQNRGYGTFDLQLLACFVNVDQHVPTNMAPAIKQDQTRLENQEKLDLPAVNCKPPSLGDFPAMLDHLRISH